MDIYIDPKIRTVTLRTALAVGAIAVAGAFGVGYGLAQALDEPTQASGAETGAAVVHTLNDAKVESLLLKPHPPLRGKAADIRFQRVG